jgi:UDP-N-acetylmuramyl pentapeptide synthase
VNGSFSEIVEATGGDAYLAVVRTGFQISGSTPGDKPAMYLSPSKETALTGMTLSDVIDRKAGCIVIDREHADRFSSRDFDESGVCLVAVDNTVTALGALASFRRRQAKIPVVAVTGSTGKTTTREMMTAVCRRRFETLSTRGI